MNRFATVRGFGHHRHIFTFFHQAAQSGPHDAMIVSKQNFDHIRLLIEIYLKL
jgi:hypothetical protein